jgi:hypothetical protein
MKLLRAFRDFTYDFYNLPNNLWDPEAGTQTLYLKA